MGTPIRQVRHLVFVAPIRLLLHTSFLPSSHGHSSGLVPVVVARTEVLHVEPEDLKVLHAVAEDVDDALQPLGGRCRSDRAWLHEAEGGSEARRLRFKGHPVGCIGLVTLRDCSCG